MKKRIINPEKVKTDLKDPTGWTIKNNPNPHPYIKDTTDENDWRNWHEWGPDGIQPIKCHSCLKRATIGSGNCLDGGEYFICLPKAVREGKRPYSPPKKIKKTKQITLL